MQKFKDQLLNVKTLAIVATVLAGFLVVAALFAALSNNTVTPTSEQRPSASSSPEAPVRPAPAPTPTFTPTPEATASPLYADCSAVWLKLERPITADDEGFPAESPNVFDLDSDGIGCEDNPTTVEDESVIDWRSVWERTKGNAEEFGDWATPKLKDFWSEFAAPSIVNSWDQLKRSW